MHSHDICLLPCFAELKLKLPSNAYVGDHDDNPLYDAVQHVGYVVRLAVPRRPTLRVGDLTIKQLLLSLQRRPYVGEIHLVNRPEQLAQSHSDQLFWFDAEPPFIVGVRKPAPLFGVPIGNHAW